MANVDIRLGYKDSTWFTANATLVLLAGQSVHLLQTGTYKIGDGTTQLSALSFLGGTSSYTSVLKHTVKAGQAINKGQAVYVSSADGTNMVVSKASNVSEALSSKTMGLLETTLALNGQGFVITEGLLAGLNTNTATIGDPVWLGVDGALIYGLVNKPYAPTHLVFIGIVTRVSATVGEIFVKVQNGFELKEIHDVDLITNAPANNDLLQYESATSLWKNKPFTFIPNVQSVTSAATVTPTTLNDEVVITAQAVALALANPTGTAVQGESLIIRIKDNGTARAITYDTQYRAIGVTLPTTTVISKTVYLGFIYNSTDTKWDCIGVSQQA
jgi:hypothetical protein